ncbi:hypothetical protein HanRHA438_Chr11g0527891 [Helianthus annuus]|nr:hypothetical protein HanRHA438_Chr11g0527891 [Helianthus annuus]
MTNERDQNRLPTSFHENFDPNIMFTTFYEVRDFKRASEMYRAARNMRSGLMGLGRSPLKRKPSIKSLLKLQTLIFLSHKTTTCTPHYCSLISLSADTNRASANRRWSSGDGTVVPVRTPRRPAKVVTAARQGDE